VPSRRAVLSTLLGAGATVGAGYLGSVAASRSGRVVVRHVAGRRVADGTSRDVDVYHAELHRDGTTDRRVHGDYRGRFEAGTVPMALHLDLRDRFEDVRYHLGHACPDCSTPAVTRREFNGAALGESVRLLYHGDGATVVPTR
jgi:hypothetical protein